jgi:hypothetical protein
MCDHTPTCPDAYAATCCAAHVIADHSEQGWSKLCNGVIVFTDGCYLDPEGRIGVIPTQGSDDANLAA